MNDTFMVFNVTDKGLAGYAVETLDRRFVQVPCQAVSRVVQEITDNGLSLIEMDEDVAAELEV